MPKFILQTSEKKKKKALVLVYFFLFTGLFLLGMGIFLNRTGLGRIANIVLGINILISGINILLRKRKELFINITEERIEWAAYSKSRNTISVYWNNIRWIKKENDGGISFFEDSSFSEYFPLIIFSAEKRNEILRLLQEKANASRIRLVNF